MLGGVHPPGLHRGLERGGEDMGLPVPRFTFPSGRNGDRRPGGVAAGKNRRRELRESLLIGAQCCNVQPRMSCFLIWMDKNHRRDPQPKGSLIRWLGNEPRVCVLGCARALFIHDSRAVLGVGGRKGRSTQRGRERRHRGSLHDENFGRLRQVADDFVQPVAKAGPVH